ncbi:MAG: hypothetical protein M3O62_08710 [Pseudomonadota bacterium]|nr:hypothetical protein [Pseudomonadota bacterium]
MTSVLKAAAILLVLLLAGLGIAFVAGLISREVLFDQLPLILAVVAILTAVGLILNLLLRNRDPR